MVMDPGLGKPDAKLQAAGHAQVNQQQALTELKDEVFAATFDAADRPTAERGEFTANGPAKRFAHGHLTNSCVLNSTGKTQASDFDFGQFGHGM
jgi:hypothetical protein